jgi:uncharacterized membrane protein (UPF0127 family)
VYFRLQPETLGRANVLNSTKLKVQVRNQTRNSVLGHSVDVADTGAKRNTGLLKHDKLQPGEGLWIIPCEGVHTFFMKFPIDLVYIDRKRKVRKVRKAVPAWRLSACLTAHSVLELPAGTAEQTGTQAGDLLEIEKLTE